MRHLLANIATYALAALLVVGAGLFGWIRSAQLVIADETTIVQTYERGPAHEFRWQELGRRSYARNCANCHGVEGQGRDRYPPLCHTAALFDALGGRDHLVDVHLWGLTSDRRGAPMPRMGHIPDPELAAVMNYVLTSFGNLELLPEDAELYVPRDVADRRAPRLSPWDVNRGRPALPVAERGCPE